MMALVALLVLGASDGRVMFPGAPINGRNTVSCESWDIPNKCITVATLMDGGVFGGTTYSAGTGIAILSDTISCVPASGVVGGCLTAEAQSIAGAKTLLSTMTVGNSARADWDGGAIVGVALAKYFEAYSQHHGFGYFADGSVGMLTADSGYAQSIGSFSCTGIGGDGIGNGQACLTNPLGIVEIYGHTIGTNQEDRGQTESLCPIELYDMGGDYTADGGTNVGPILCMAKIGSADKIWRLMRNGDVYMDGNELRLRGPRSIVRAGQNGSPTSVGLELFGNIAQGGGRARAAAYVANQNFLQPNDELLQVTDTNNAGHFGVTTQGAVRFGQMATVSEQTCPGASSVNLGQVHFSLTENALRLCTSAGWKTLAVVP